MVLNRFVDKPYSTYSVRRTVMQGICVKCPRCGRMGLVTTDKEWSTANVYFDCAVCGYTKRKKQVGGYHCNAENLCGQCGRYYRMSIYDNKKQKFPVLHVACPYCGYKMPTRIQKIPANIICDNSIRHGREPFFDLELWFLTTYKGKFVWALNREHLSYLIDYLSADLRDKPSADGWTKRTVADQLPHFMKTAKNREGVVKCLKRMQS